MSTALYFDLRLRELSFVLDFTIARKSEDTFVSAFMINLKLVRYFFNFSVNALDILNERSLSRSFNTAEISSMEKIRHSNH